MSADSVKLIPALLIVLLASCEREPLTLAQGQILEQLNPGATVRPFRNDSSCPSALARKSDGSVWLYVFGDVYSKDPFYEEELIPALQLKTKGIK